jgi:hypothetical protein
MRNPALRALLTAVVALALIASAGGAVGGAATAPSSVDAVGARALPADGPGIAPASAPGPTPVPVGAATDGGPPAAVGATAGEAGWRQTGGGVAAPSRTRIRVDLNADRSADWTVAVRYSLADGNETAAFRTAGQRFEAGEIGPTAQLFEGFRREANRDVDRRMAIEDVDREFEVYDDPAEFEVAAEDAAAVGELRLTFTWTAFLERDGENLVLGDALTIPGNETWLRSLEESQTLEVGTPDGYTVTGTPSSAVTQLSDGDVIIEGPQTFEGDEPVAIVYGPAGTGPPWGLLTAAALLAAVLVAGSAVGYRRFGGGGATDEPAVNGGEMAGGAADPDRSAGERDEGRPASAEPDDASDAAEGDEADDEPDLSLLSDEERVERLLDANGGRMRQADIVAETGWSDAKVSQLLSAMADEGRVEKLRLGRENLISLPDDADDEGDEA